ncbi:MAG: hypothetical protein ABW292_16750 [Vicinamibacterales bacterium]
MHRAYQSAKVQTAQRLLLDLARRLETEHPSSAESLLSRTSDVRRNVTR